MTNFEIVKNKMELEEAKTITRDLADICSWGFRLPSRLTSEERIAVLKVLDTCEILEKENKKFKNRRIFSLIKRKESYCDEF